MRPEGRLCPKHLAWFPSCPHICSTRPELTFKGKSLGNQPRRVVRRRQSQELGWACLTPPHPHPTPPPCRLVPWGSVSGAGFTPRAAGVASTPSPPHLPPTAPGVGSPPTEVTALEPSSWGLLPRGPQPETLLSPTWARPVTYVASLTPPGSSLTQIPSRHLPSRVHRAPSLTPRSPQ